MNEFIRPLTPDDHPGPPDSYLDDEPTASAGLSVVLEPAQDATVGELVRSLVRAILSAISGRTRTRA